VASNTSTLKPDLNLVTKSDFSVLSTEAASYSVPKDEILIAVVKSVLPAFLLKRPLPNTSYLNIVFVNNSVQAVLSGFAKIVL